MQKTAKIHGWWSLRSSRDDAILISKYKNIFFDFSRSHDLSVLCFVGPVLGNKQMKITWKKAKEHVKKYHVPPGK